MSGAVGSSDTDRLQHWSGGYGRSKVDVGGRSCVGVLLLVLHRVVSRHSSAGAMHGVGVGVGLGVGVGAGAGGGVAAVAFGTSRPGSTTG